MQVDAELLKRRPNQENRPRQQVGQNNSGWRICGAIGIAGRATTEIVDQWTGEPAQNEGWNQGQNYSWPCRFYDVCNFQVAVTAFGSKEGQFISNYNLVEMPSDKVSRYRCGKTKYSPVLDKRG